MTSYIEKAKNRAKKLKARKQKRLELVGEEGVIKQNSRNFNKKVRGALTKGDSIDKAAGREAIKRVGEYKKGKFSKMAAGGKTSCRGWGAAKRGGGCTK